ncbi:MAG: single-stranded DNA-binding protein [Proteobacteria bacterium]|nr:single-stranded DNA-binding protein [Pseudomonadota bacterium]
MSINRAIILGNVGKDPEIRTSQGGDRVATFSLATSETWKDKNTGERKEATEWHTIVVFNQNIVPVIESYVKKGSRVAIEGQIKTRKWQDKEGKDRWSTEIVIGRFDGRLSLEGQPSGGPQREEHGYGTTRTKDDPRTMQGQPPSGRPADLDDDIPF